MRVDREASSIRKPKTAQDRAGVFIEVNFGLLAHSYSYKGDAITIITLLLIVLFYPLSFR